MAQLELARGRLVHATALERRAVDTIPLPQFVGLYADLLHATGHPRAAAVQYATEDGIRRLFAANGVRTDLETALFDVDHGIRLHASLALARQAQRERPSIDGDDVLAWALARNGRCGEALHYSRLALRLGTNDTAKLFHRAEIERCLGHDPRPWARRALGPQPPLLRSLDLDPEEACIMKRLSKRLLIVATLCYLLVPVAAASAHPLGNFTINRFARVEVAGDRLYVRYVVDMAEIPTLQRVPIRIGALSITANGRPVSLRVVRTVLAHPRGAAGLRTTRFQAILAGPRVAGDVNVAVNDRNYASRIGWKEIVFGAITPLDLERVARVSEGPALEPARRLPGLREPRPDPRRAARAALRQGARGTRPDRRLRASPRSSAGAT